MNLFKSDPVKKAKKLYNAKLVEARDAQRAGQIVRYSELMEEAEQLAKNLEQTQK